MHSQLTLLIYSTKIGTGTRFMCGKSIKNITNIYISLQNEKKGMLQMSHNSVNITQIDLQLVSSQEQYLQSNKSYPTPNQMERWS